MKSQLDEIYKKIVTACAKSNRSPQDVKLIAVSKTQTLEQIRKAISCGCLRFGENYVQEFIEKHDQLKDHKVEWHFIGHLQTNKAKLVVGKAALIHSVDSVRLCEVISRSAQAQGIRQRILLQVNLAGEASKGGFEPDDLRMQIANLSQLPGVELCGLMIIPPNVENPEDARGWFHQLRILGADLIAKAPSHSMNQLSMGMSHDYAVAVEEGATYVRIGTAIFGERKSL